MKGERYVAIYENVDRGVLRRRLSGGDLGARGGHIGMLMIPKTITYVIVCVLAYNDLFRPPAAAPSPLKA